MDGNKGNGAPFFPPHLPVPLERRQEVDLRVPIVFDYTEPAQRVKVHQVKSVWFMIDTEQKLDLGQARGQL